MQTLNPSTKLPSFVKELKHPKTVSAQETKRILHLAGTDRGGIWMAEQLRELQSRAYEVKAYISGYGRLSEKLESCGVPFELAELEVAWSFKQVIKFVKNVYALSWRLWQGRFDVVHAHLFPTIIIARFAAWIVDVPVRIVMIPGPFYMEAEMPALLELATAWMDTRILPSCKFTRELYLNIGVPASKLELVYYGPDEKYFDARRVDKAACRKSLLDELGLPKDVQIIGLVAYFYPVLPESDFVPSYLWNRAVKNHETVVEAALHVSKQCPNAHFVLVGDGWGKEGATYLETIKEMVVNKGLTGCISFLGGRENVPELIAAFDVSLQCSLNENLGGTIESLLMEKPIVGSRVGGIVDSVLHEETGLLFESTDSLELADAIIRLLTDRKFAAQLGKNGRELMLNKFSLECTANDLDAVYQRCFAERDKFAFLGRPGYRFWVVPWRALACLWWIGFSISLFCRAEMRGRLQSAKQQTSCHVNNFCYAVKAQVKNMNRDPAQVILSSIGDLIRNLMETAKLCLRQVSQSFRRNLYLLVKRCIDIIGALLILAAFSPLLLFLLPFYWVKKVAFFQERKVMGRSNKTFSLLLLNALPETASARLRQISSYLLFLPTCINVIRGEMSLVGTRLRSAALEVDGRRDYLEERWHMSPGLTGWCQLNMDIEHGEAELNGLDFLYIANSSYLLDLKILIKTCLQLALNSDKRKDLSLWVPE